MLKRILIIAIIAISATISVCAQDTYVVQQFGNSLTNWASRHNDFSAMQDIERLCSTKPAIRIDDPIMSAMAIKYNVPRSKSYTLDDYIRCIQHEVDAGVSISFSDIRQVPENLKPSNYPGVNYVSCNVKFSGASNLNENDVFAIKNGKIVKIEEYVVVRDKKGRQKLRIDLSGLGLDEDTEGWGLSYNYSKAFPVGASVAYTKWKFMISMDFGVNFDKDLYTTQKVDFNNIGDYKITKGEYDLKYFITATPAFYMKYFAVGWGFGYASFDGSETSQENKLEIKSDGTIIQTTGTSSVSGGGKYKFMMRPTIKGYIPCSDNFFISLSVNYDWILGYKEKSGISFGAGIHFLID
jgi:hypothetical protein